ncbi:MAG TPA: selenocysteine-specific translation elongation factor [Spirochaetota bacterium]|nr:selenocysteine-specific translation elongation factor [Spirochaetota bacterium]HRZ26383.1 selenocysteine-specific translation elongation factor [Spirochaetota bacterium]HSA14301.1 selenocysteine-specific translation elongation factor [Spirochaetota bacterium]
MYIVGTSGHIDHGKTSLIQALTGTNCDRLPEEKEREMTIDIGFASIDYPRFGTVSIIDVPGHERFIRNMVAGAWGIDLGLLVVAADDGWMPQTEDHFRVLQLLGIERLIAVINKTDLADAEMADLVEEEIRQKLEGTPYAGSDIAKVSSRTMDGIDNLKNLIVENLRRLRKASDAGKPYLYVDRVFASRGHGTVVTGTLKNGAFREDDDVTVLPGRKGARIKKIESHYHEQNEGSPSQRTGLNLPGIGTDEVRRGSIVVRDNFFAESGDIIAELKLLERRKEIKNNLGIEILVGTASVKGKLILMDEEYSGQESFAARVRLDEPWFFYPGEKFILTSPGGFRVLGGGTVLLPGYDSRRYKKIIREALAERKSGDAAGMMEFILSVNGWAKRDELVAGFPLGTKKLEKTADELITAGRAVALGPFMVTPAFFESAARAIAGEIESRVGPNLKEISDLTGIPLEVCRSMMSRVMEKTAVIEKEGRYFSGSSVTEDNLPAAKRKILTDIEAAGAEGAELDKIADKSLKHEIGELIKLNFLVSLDGNIIYHKKTYEAMTGAVMKLFDTREKITLQEARDASGLSRKYLLPLLNRIERDGLVRRLGDFRIKT